MTNVGETVMLCGSKDPCFFMPTAEPRIRHNEHAYIMSTQVDLSYSCKIFMPVNILRRALNPIKFYSHSKTKTLGTR